MNIIHLDLDAFYCAVEEKRNPELVGKAFAVGGKPNERGVVSSCSYPARQRGVRSAMPMAQALRLCPDLIIVSGHYHDYSSASKEVMARLKSVTPLVEQISIDEAFLDVTDLQEDPAEIARNLQEQIRSELGLPCSLGVASSKLVAKIASDFGKGQFKGEGAPNALTVVPHGSEAEFLAPLPVRALWGIGPKTEERLNALDITTIGQLAEANPDQLTRSFGKHGADMARRARGIDRSKVTTEREAKSFSQEVTFVRDATDWRPMKEEIRRQSARVARMLQKNELAAATVRLKLRWSDFTTLTRQITISQPTNDPEVIAGLAWRLFRKAWKPRRPVRLIGVGVSGLGEQPKQMSLWDALEEEAE